MATTSIPLASCDVADESLLDVVADTRAGLTDLEASLDAAREDSRAMHRRIMAAIDDLDG